LATIASYFRALFVTGRLTGGTGIAVAARDATEVTPATAREWLTTSALVAVLLAYANGSAWRASRCGKEIAVGTNGAHLAMLGLMLVWAWVERLRPHELGLTRGTLKKSVLTGAGVAAAGAVLIRTFFALPLVTNWPVDIAEYRGLSRRRLIWLLCGQFFLGSALFEEVAFRGLLHAKLVRLLGARSALAMGSAVFTAWHVVIAWHNVRRCNVSPRWFAPLYGGVLAVLFAAGYLFGLVRQWTGHVGGSVITHWVLIGHILLEVARLGGAPDPFQQAIGGELLLDDLEEISAIDEGPSPSDSAPPDSANETQ
jgi:membrane protease YdiL (CAAX protease family)